MGKSHGDLTVDVDQCAVRVVVVAKEILRRPQLDALEKSMLLGEIRRWHQKSGEFMK